ncbi:host cell division inhibitor Icd-like protein [Rouxiella badensis]|uniref:host cell division inhibitor Icd-like protein n=1 Tax=Rouxiella badensis TaxID=1646377 RepID=UPI003C786372
MNADQKAAFLLAGDLTILNIHNRSKSDMEFNFPAWVRGLEGFSDITTRGGEFFQAIKQGRVSGTAPSRDEDTSQSVFTYIFAVRRWRRLISLLAAAIKKPAVLSPSSFNFSISSKSVKGSLTETCSERLFFLPVAITDAPVFRWCSVYTGKLFVKALRWCSPCYTLVVFTLSTGKEQVIHKIAKPGSASTLTGPLTKPLYEVTVMADSQHTQTRPKFQYRFLALDRANRRATPCRLTVEASTEHEARLILCAHFILSLAARLPVSGSAHV